MNKTKPELIREKCRLHGQCLKVAPQIFVLDQEKKVTLVPDGEAADEVLLKSAKSCPYRAIRIVDLSNGEQLFPVRRPKPQEMQ
jgi:ferredoxin